MASQNLNLVLTAFPALTSTITVKNAQTLAANAAQIANWDNRQVLALIAFSLTYVLNHAGGTDYRTNHAQLNQDVQTFMGTLENVANGRPGDYLDKCMAVIVWNQAYDLDTTITTNLNTILTNMKGIPAHSEEDLRDYILYLRYACSIKGV